VKDPAGRTAESRTTVHVREAAIALQARSLEGSQVELSWSDPTAEFELQSSPELGSPLDWQPATEGPPSEREGRSYVQLPTSGSHRYFRLHRKGLVTLPSPVVLQKDQDLRLGEGTLTLVSLDLRSYQLNVSGPGRLVLPSVIGTTGSRVTVQGPGTVEIAGAFSGSLEIRGGRVALSAASLITARGVNLLGGSLVLEAGSILNSSAPLSLAGGVLEINGAHGDLGPLELAGNTTLQLGTGTGALTFASARISGASGRLAVEGWKGTAGGTGIGQTIFLKSAPGADFLARVTFTGPEYGAGANYLATRELVPSAKALSVVPSSFAAFLPYGSVTKTTVAMTGQSFVEALRVTTTQMPTQVYNAGIQVKTIAAVAAQDNLLARFWVRKVAPAGGSAQTMFNFEMAGGTFDKSTQLLVTLADTNWQQKTVRFKALAAYGAGAAQVSFWTGYAQGTIEIAGLEVLNYQGNTPP
ncbi:MAG: hypothetical protein JNK85_28005, partial [Verrucomicrobiales bacterium]|nr:hypothetical protein [Verrucomicrobiales bacterium]